MALQDTDTKITRIAVKGLWGLCDLVWDLEPEVNVLSGTNGSGKSTVLQALGNLFAPGGLTDEDRDRMEGMVVTLADGTRVCSTQMGREASSQAQAQGLDTRGRYRIGVALPGLSTPEITQANLLAAAGEAQQREQLYTLLDELFALTGKRVDKSSSKASSILQFQLKGGSDGETTRKIELHQLSSGEKRMLGILSQVVSYAGKPFTLILDEPEISLHLDWQKRLIEDILCLNANAQLILATHSPAVVMHGWLDRIAEINDLILPLGSVNL